MIGAAHHVRLGGGSIRDTAAEALRPESCSLKAYTAKSAVGCGAKVLQHLVGGDGRGQRGDVRIAIGLAEVYLLALSLLSGMSRIGLDCSDIRKLRELHGGGMLRRGRACHPHAHRLRLGPAINSERPHIAKSIAAGRAPAGETGPLDRRTTQAIDKHSTRGRGATSRKPHQPRDMLSIMSRRARTRSQRSQAGPSGSTASPYLRSNAFAAACRRVVKSLKRSSSRT